MKDLFKQLLVPVSGSESSVVAGKLAIQLAKEHGSLLVFVHVVDVAVRDRLARLSGRTPDIVQRELEENGERYLNYMVRLAEGEGVKAEKVLRVGVTDVFGGGLCTVTDAARFYSYRRDGATGRMAICIWRE